MKICIACGMPMTDSSHHGLGDESLKSCVFCTDENGFVKPGDEIFKGGVDFFVKAIGCDQNTAEKLVRRNMKELSYWKDKNLVFLKGELATDEEFENAIKLLQEYS